MNNFDLPIEAICNQTHEVALMQRWANAKRGLVLITGPDGSGKTTTAYALMKYAAQKKKRKVFSIESQQHQKIKGVIKHLVALNDDDACKKAFQKILEQNMDMLFVAGNPSLWSHAVKVAKGHHLVMVQLDAPSAMHALHTFRQATNPAAEDTLVGVVWQELVEDKRTQKRKAK